MSFSFMNNTGLFHSSWPSTSILKKKKKEMKKWKNEKMNFFCWIYSTRWLPPFDDVAGWCSLLGLREIRFLKDLLLFFRLEKKKEGPLPILLLWWISTWVGSWFRMMTTTTFIITSWCFQTFISSIFTQQKSHYSIHWINTKFTSWWWWSRWWTRTSSSTIAWTTWSTSIIKKRKVFH